MQFLPDIGHAGLNLFQVVLKRGVKLPDYLLPSFFAFLDQVELPFHVPGKTDLEHIGKPGDQDIIHYHPQFCRLKLALFAFDIVPVKKSGNYRSVSRGPADAVRLKPLYQSCFSIAGRGLGEFLFGQEIFQTDRLVLFKLGQFLFLFPLTVYLFKPAKLTAYRIRTEIIIPARNLYFNDRIAGI